jgi:biopolymer transport protein ExbB/TolQ
MIYIEWICLIGMLLLQVKSFYTSLGEIAELQTLFPASASGKEAIETIEINGHSVEQLAIAHYNRTFRFIVQATNAYLGKNKGSADFNIIRSIADRSADSQENRISSSLSIPLYLGLMGTFIGVILGLASIAITGLSLDNTDIAISELIRGVVMAMIVSLVGLALTTYLNVKVFKNAVAIRDVCRNNYFNFLQAELLPNLDNNLYSALDQFRANIANFNLGFSANLKIFDTSFNENIKHLKSTVEGMSMQIEAVTNNTSVQLEFIKELKGIGYNRMAEANIRVFDKIKEAGPMLVSFIKEQQKLTQNLEQANTFSEHIAGLMNRVSSFEDGITNLGRELQQSDLIGGELIAVVRKHLTAIEQKEYLINDYAARSGSEVESYLKAALERVQHLKNKIEIDFEKAFDFDAEHNLMQNLKHLKVIDENTAGLNQKLELRNTKILEDKFDVLIEILKEKDFKKDLVHAQSSINESNKVTPKKEPKLKRSWWNRLTNRKILENASTS